MGQIKEDLKLLDYLKEKGISHEDIKKMIEESIEDVLEKGKGSEKEPEVIEEPEPEKVPTFTKDDINELIRDEVQNQLKIKRKVPSKGKIIEPSELPEKKEASVEKNWFEVIV